MIEAIVQLDGGGGSYMVRRWWWLHGQFSLNIPLSLNVHLNYLCFTFRKTWVSSLYRALKMFFPRLLTEVFQNLVTRLRQFSANSDAIHHKRSQKARILSGSQDQKTRTILVIFEVLDVSYKGIFNTGEEFTLPAVWWDDTYLWKSLFIHTHPI